MESSSAEPARGAILEPGRTCWRVARAERFGLIVDAADYFARARAAMLRAERSIMLVGWDFDLRIDLTPDMEDDGVPTQLGPFLKEITRRRPELRIFILKWDMSVLMTLREQMLPVFVLDLKAAERIRLRFDSAHPWTAAHHQKIVVIDDALAFCGGIDMTSDRWDTRGHLPHDERRRRPDGSISGPWHDATAVVDGEAARALGDLARERWRRATGRRLSPPSASSDPWPEELEPILRDVEIGVSRTMPAYGGHPAVHEIEALYLAAIRAAEKTIYLESQYLASASLCDALAERLREPGGPEVVVVNPLTTAGWLEQETMGVSRDLRLTQLRRADRHGRLGVYYPANAAGEEIYVHAKVLVVDDRLFRVGSSNVNNRSMGFDTECDVTIQAESAQEREAVLAMRDDLLAEHLDVAPREVGEASARHGSLRAAVEALRRPEGRSLRPIPIREVNEAEAALARSHLADPERPRNVEGRVAHLVKRLVLRASPFTWLLSAAALAALVALLLAI